MATVNDITITLSVNPSSLSYFITELKIVENLGVESSYTIQNKDNIKFNESTVDDWLTINIPIELYITFMYYYQLS